MISISEMRVIARNFKFNQNTKNSETNFGPHGVEQGPLHENNYQKMAKFCFNKYLMMKMECIDSGNNYEKLNSS